MSDTFKAAECGLCGVRSVPGLGLAIPCKVGYDGRHGDLRQVVEPVEKTAKRLAGLWPCIPGFDRARFLRRADPVEMLILRRGLDR